MKGFHSVLTAVFVILLVVGCREREGVDFEVPTVSVSILNDGPLTIGDPIDVALTIISKKNSTLVFPEDGEHFSPFILKDYTTKKMKVGRSIHKTLVIYRLAIYNTGMFIFQPLSIKIGDNVHETQPLKVQILSILPKDVDELKPKDIIPPYRPRVRPYFIVIVTLSILLMSGMVYFAYRFLKKRVRKTQMIKRPSVEKIIDPYQYSIEELEKVKQQFVKNAMSSKQVYTEISGILRYFIGRIFSINAPQMTTGEIRRALTKKLLNFLPSHRFTALLGRSDLVKFARENLERENVEQDIEESIGIIRGVNTGVKEKEGG
jgi:hypothetical protein